MSIICIICYLECVTPQGKNFWNSNNQRCYVCMTGHICWEYLVLFWGRKKSLQFRTLFYSSVFLLQGPVLCRFVEESQVMLVEWIDGIYLIRELKEVFFFFFLIFMWHGHTSNGRHSLGWDAGSNIDNKSIKSTKKGMDRNLWLAQN